MQEHMSAIGCEIRTDITSTIGLSELMLKGKFGSLSEDQKSVVAEINKRVKHLKGAFDELVEMYLLTSGNLQLNIAKVDTDQLLDQAIADSWQHWLLKNKSTRSDIVKQDIPSTLPKIWADSSRIQRAVTGMLVEAIRAVHNDDESEIVFTASYDDTWITLQVIIAEEDPYHYYNSNSPNIFFCQSVVEMHGGQMSLERRKESQVKVTLILPIRG
jgi:signal transduction histidine kinase